MLWLIGCDCQPGCRQEATRAEPQSARAGNRGDEDYAVSLTPLLAAPLSAACDRTYCCKSCWSVVYACCAEVRSPDCRSWPICENNWEIALLSWLPEE